MKLVPPFIKGPLSMVHFVTLNCNARCSHCFIDFNNPETFKGDLKVDEIDKITKSIGYQLKNVNLTGGEPFLRRDLFDIARCYFENTKIKTMYITTNGFFTQFTKEFIEKFITSKYDDRVLIFSLSIDSFPEEHNANRKVKGLFDKTVETYRMIRSFSHPNILANVNLTVIPANYQKMIDIYNFLVDEIGIKSFTTTLVREEGVMKIPRELKEGLLSTYKELNKLIKNDIMCGRIEGYQAGFIGKVLNAKNIVMQDIIEKTFLNNEFVTPCYAGDVFLVLNSNGEVRPCEVLQGKNLGNLRDFNYDVKKLWSSERAKEIRKWIIGTKCRCTYECAATFNVLFNSKHIPSLVKNIVEMDVGKLMKKKISD